jgi:hypothetical protein
MDQLDIIPVDVDSNSRRGSRGGGGEGGGGPPSGGGDGSVIGQVATKTLSSQIFHLQQIVGDTRNKVISSISDQCKYINTLNVNVKCIALAPGVHGHAAILPTTAHMVLRLSKCPRDLWVLWKDWDQGLGGENSAKAFTPAKRGANKFSFSRQKVFWDTVKGMIRRGQTADMAINNVYQVYRWNHSVTQILKRMKDDRRRGVKRV